MVSLERSKLIGSAAENFNSPFTRVLASISPIDDTTADISPETSTITLTKTCNISSDKYHIYAKPAQIWNQYKTKQIQFISLEVIKSLLINVARIYTNAQYVTLHNL